MTEEDDNDRYVQIMPAGGWCVKWLSDGGWMEPLVGWALTREGTVIPLFTDAKGNVEDSTTVSSNSYWIFHKDGVPSSEDDGH